MPPQPSRDHDILTCHDWSSELAIQILLVLERTHDVVPRSGSPLGFASRLCTAAADAQARRLVLGTQAQKRAARLAAAVQRRHNVVSALEDK